MVTVELFGLPGAGKTSILEQLAGRVVDGWDATSKIAARRFAVHHPLRASRALSATMRSQSPTFATAKLALFRERQAVAVSHCANEDIVVFHEGILTATRRIQTRESPPLSAQVLENLLPASDIVVIVDTPEDVALERFLSRLEKTGVNDPIIPLLDRPEDAMKRWEVIRRATEMVIAALPTTTARVDGMQPVDTNAEEVLDLALSAQTPDST